MGKNNKNKKNNSQEVGKNNANEVSSLSFEELKQKVQDIGKTKEEIQEIIDKSNKALEILKDRFANKQRLSMETGKLEKKQKELERIQRELDENSEFKYQSKQGNNHQTSNDSMMRSISDLNAPSEELPSIGILKENGQRRLLEIEDWEEVNEAQEQAKRLNASLSVKK